MTFSIIIPAYNVRKYIGDCLDSLIVETWRYDLTATERAKMWLMAHCPWLLVGMVRYLTLTKRLVLKCVRR